MATYKVTDQELFAQVEVDLSGITNHISNNKGELVSVDGDIEISVDKDNGSRCYSGEHGCWDYEDDYGFVIISE